MSSIGAGLRGYIWTFTSPVATMQARHEAFESRLMLIGQNRPLYTQQQSIGLAPIIAFRYLPSASMKGLVIASLFL